MRSHGVSHYVEKMRHWPESPLKSAIASIVWWDTYKDGEQVPKEWARYMDDMDSHNQVSKQELCLALTRLGWSTDDAVARVYGRKKS